MLVVLFFIGSGIGGATVWRGKEPLVLSSEIVRTMAKGDHSMYGEGDHRTVTESHHSDQEVAPLEALFLPRHS